MKIFLKKILVFLGIIAAISATTNLTTSIPASARGYGVCDYSFLGLTPWDCNAKKEIQSQGDLIEVIATIATNILTDLTVIASYLVLGYVIYGGFLYIMSSGDPGKVASGKKTLIHAFIGLAIVISAYTIFGAIRVAIAGNIPLEDCALSSCAQPGDLVSNLIGWVSGIIGVVSAVFILIGAWGYITSAGEPNKLQKAKQTILYAVIGIIVFALAQIITSFVATTVKNANSGVITNSVIANINKESHEV